MSELAKRIEDSAAIHLEDIGNALLSKTRVKKLNNTDFSIISNNCWGGHVYRRYGLSYSSPTVGLYFFSDDYMRFLDNLREYLHTPLRFIKSHESKHYHELLKRKQLSIPIGVLGDDVEIMFLHYKSEEEALDKWSRRCQRVNYDNLIVKHSQMNNCTDDHLVTFDELPYRKKIAFVSPSFNKKLQCAAIVKKYSDSVRVLDDTTYFYQHVNLDDLINS